MDSIKHNTFAKLKQNRNILLFPIVVVCFLFLSCASLYGQKRSQAKLLYKAYKNQSEQMLFNFFDNWSKEISSNENDAPDQWVAEAHKVYTAFYQPFLLKKDALDYPNFFGEELYQENPYFIVQSSLWEILVMEKFHFTPGELEEFLSRYRYAFWKLNSAILVDSGIVFRPPVQFSDKKIVYLTPKYKKLLDMFLGGNYRELGKHNIMRPATSEDQSRSKMEFINKAAHIFYGHWGGYWQYETYPKANMIVFDSEMHHAVVLFRFVYEGGFVILEKTNDEWTIVTIRYNWIE